jgi:hypothetical protein
MGNYTTEEGIQDAMTALMESGPVRKIVTDALNADAVEKAKPSHWMKAFAAVLLELSPLADQIAEHAASPDPAAAPSA